MPSLGEGHAVFLISDGSAVAVGSNDDGQCDLPELEENATYTQVSAGNCHTACLRHDGVAVACGWNDSGQCDLPDLDEGVRYTQVSAGRRNTGLLRSDGTAAVCGGNTNGQCDVPVLENGLTYTQVSVGDFHTVLLRSDGCAVACGLNAMRQCEVPVLEKGLAYTQVSAGAYQTALLRSDGVAFACGWDEETYQSGCLVLKEKEKGLTYTQVSCGFSTIALLRNDGMAISIGDNRCDVPMLGTGEWYCQVVAGRGGCTGFLFSDGQACVCGHDDDFGQYVGVGRHSSLERFDLSLERDLQYVPNWSEQSVSSDLVVQLFIEDIEDVGQPALTKASLRSIAGNELNSWLFQVPGRVELLEPPKEAFVQQSIAEVLEPGCQRLWVVLKDCQHCLLSPRLRWSDLLTGGQLTRLALVGREQRE